MTVDITTSGVKGYEYQYKATVLIGLYFLDSAHSLLVEEKGKEDATIRINVNQTITLIEIQAKNKKGNIDIVDFSDWVCHFGNHSHDSNLLSRVRQYNHHILFITSGRCLDDISFFTKQPPQFTHAATLKVTRKWLDKFKLNIGRGKYPGFTKLQKDRDKFCKTQADSLKYSPVTNKQLTQIVIWEMISENQIDKTITEYLNRMFKIPQGLAYETYCALLDSVRAGRDNQTNIVRAFKNVIDKRRGAGPKTDIHYKSRTEQTMLIDRLSQDSVLFLTGSSQCGKSELAKKLSETFYNQGYSYLITNEVNAVSLFFSQNPTEDKICILEDPWGHIQPFDNSLDLWRKLETVLRNKSGNHLLIVTSRTEIIREIFSLGHSLKNFLDKYSWNDLTLIDKEILKSFWAAFAIENKTNREAVDKIMAYVNAMDKGSSLQIGQLQFLSRVEENDLAGKDIGALLHLARSNATEVGINILTRNAGAANILTVLSICSDTITPLSLTDLGYILSADDYDYSIIPERESGSFDTLDRVIEFPAYEPNIDVSNTIQRDLEYLEKRGIIFIQANNIFITHPNYYEAGRSLFRTPGSFHLKRVINYFRKSISCLNPDNSLLAIKQIPFLLSMVFEDTKAEIISLVFTVLNSIFPAVRDRALIILINNILNFTEEQNEELTRRLEFGDTHDEHLVWHGEIPFISMKGSDFITTHYFRLSKEEISELDNKINADLYLSALSAWNYLRAIRNERIPLSAFALRYFMRYEEIFIRKAAVSHFILRGIDLIDFPALEFLFSDEHPSVIFNIIKSCLTSWKDHEPEVKSRLMSLILGALENLGVVIRSNQLLTTFSKSYASDAIAWERYNKAEKSELWNIWGELFPAFIRKLPTNAFLNSGRFTATMDEAVSYLTNVRGMAVLEAWYTRIDTRTADGFALDDHELSIGMSIMEFTKDDYQLRSVLFGKMFRHEDTNFLLSNLKWVMSYWENLHPEEKKMVLSLVRSERTDIRWIRAVSLNTYNNPPGEIQMTILGNKSYFSRNTDEFIKEMDSGLLKDCLTVFSGHPQPLWWLALHHHNIQFWHKIMKYILLNEIEPSFSVCLRELVSNGVMGFSGSWREGMSVWKMACENNANKQVLAERLFYDISRTNCNITSASQMLSILNNRYVKDDEAELFAILIASKFEMIQQTSDKRDVIEIFGKDLLKSVLKYLIPDYLLLNALSLLESDLSETEPMLKIIDLSIQKTLSVRFFGTLPHIQRKIKAFNLESLYETKLSQIHDQIDVKGKRDQEKIDQKEDYKLSDWIGLN